MLTAALTTLICRAKHANKFDYSMSESNVILGFASDPWKSEEGCWWDTHIGGLPIFPPSFTFSVPPCPLCSSARFHVLQAYAPHAQHTHRVIYVFGCNNIRCSSQPASWLAVRLCEVNKSTEVSKPKTSHILEMTINEPASINWDTDSDDSDSSDSDLLSSLENLSLQVQTARNESMSQNINNPTHNRLPLKGNTDGFSSSDAQETTIKKEGCAEISGLHPTSSFMAYHVEVDIEPPDRELDTDFTHANYLRRKYEQGEEVMAVSGSAEVWGVEEEDQNDADIHMDLFRGRLSRAPDQIIRYSFNGEPLWPKSPAPQLSSPKCVTCGAEMVFEMQVLGTCLHYLNPEKSLPDQPKEAAMNFAAITIFTCIADCTENVCAENPSFKMNKQIICVQHDDWIGDI